MTIGLAAKLKNEAGFDFVSVLNDPQKAYELIGQLYEDLDKFPKVIHMATGMEISLDEFMEAMDGEVIADAFEALDQSFTNFYRPGKREQIARWKEQLKQGLENQQDLIMEELDQKMQEGFPNLLKEAVSEQISGK
tara:strand:+ start:786 stop:1193 length:408 start_codon:yes stop_codon:yes gene_type:complete